MTDRNWFNTAFILSIAPCAFFRFVVFFPLSKYWSLATNHWDVIKDHDILSKGLYGPAIAAGEKIAANWGAVAFYWNFAVWAPSFWFIPPFNLPFMVVDIVITIYLSKATHYQTSYAPHSEAACNKGAAYTWHRPSGTNESFFEAAGRLNGTIISPEKMCMTFVSEWQYGITLSFFYALISLIQIVAFVGALLGARKRGESLQDLSWSLLRGIIAFTLDIPRWIAWLLLGILYFLPEWLFRCLPHSVKSKVRLGRRYALKGGLSLEQKAEVGVVELKGMYKQNKNGELKRYQGSCGENVPLSKFLGVYDMLMTVTEQLHYSDVMNLSRVSKSVRDSVLPSHDFARRLETFRRYTCDENKQGCCICDKQVCMHCLHLPLIPRTTLTHHITCRPHCTPCYTRIILARRPLPSQRLRAPHCTCAPLPSQPHIIMRWLHGPKYYATRQANQSKMSLVVCRECNLHSADELTEIFERKKKSQLLRGLKGDGKRWERCAGPCGKALGRGPRWWVCANAGCWKECRGVVHKGWGWRGGKDVGGEDV